MEKALKIKEEKERPDNMKLELEDEIYLKTEILDEEQSDNEPLLASEMDTNESCDNVKTELPDDKFPECKTELCDEVKSELTDEEFPQCETEVKSEVSDEEFPQCETEVKSEVSDEEFLQCETELCDDVKVELPDDEFPQSETELVEVKIEPPEFAKDDLDNVEFESEEAKQEGFAELSRKLLIQRKFEIRVLAGKETSTATYGCPFCPYQNDKPKSVEKHSKIHSIVNKFKCDKCTYECPWKSTLDRHMNSRHGDKTKKYKCDKCDYTARYKISMDRHILNHAQLKPFACNLCDYKGNSQGYLRAHMIVHAETKPYLCSLCDYASNNNQGLKRHMEVHANPNKRTRKYMRNEQKTVIRTPEGLYKCTVCDYEGTSVNAKNHFAKEHSSLEYTCDQCSYHTYRRDLLRSHKLTHTTEKKYQCNMCNFSARWNHALLTHMNSRHLNRFRHKCEKCSYSTNRKSTFVKHLSRCGENFCQLCRKSFQYRIRLSRHIEQYHKGEEELCTNKTSSSSE